MHPKYLVPCAFTVAALIAGFLSIIKVMAGDYYVAAQLIMLSMLLDGFDGNVARMLKAESKFGAEFDTFVDIISFGVAPALLAYQSALRHLPGHWGFMLSAAIVLSGAMRLARFRVVDPHRGQHGFLGLPITVCAGWIALWSFVCFSSAVDETVYSLSRGPLAFVVWGSVTAFVLLEVSHVRYPKPTKDLLFFLPSVFLVLALFMKAQVGIMAALAMAAYGAFYAFVTPFLPREAMIDLNDDEEEDPLTAHQG